MVEFTRHLRQLGKAGIQTYSLVGLDYSDVADLSVSVGVSLSDPSPVVATFSVDELRQTYTILTPTISGGEFLEIVRATDATDSSRPVNWLTKTTPLTAEDLNDSIDHLLFVAQEAQDQAEELGRFSPYMGIFEGVWEGQGLQMKNVGAHTEMADAVRKDEMDAAIGGANNLPAVTGGDNDSGLAVVTGAWATTTPANLLTAWGITGSAALLEPGTGSLNLLQLDANGYLPAVDARNVDFDNNTDVSTILRRPAVACTVHMDDPLWATNTSDTAWWYASGQRMHLNGANGTRTAINCDQTVVKTDQIQTWSALDLEEGTWLIRWSGAATRLSGTPTHYFNFGAYEDDNTSGCERFWEWNMEAETPPSTSVRINFDYASGSSGAARPVSNENQLWFFSGAMIKVSTGLLQGGDGVCFRGRDSGGTTVTHWHHIRVTAIKLSD